eukprot:5597905-Pleurochrysis_carterae.AAC.1
MTPDTRCKADVTDDKKAETHSLPVAADDAPRRVTDTDTESSSGEDGEIVRLEQVMLPLAAYKQKLRRHARRSLLA